MVLLLLTAKTYDHDGKFVYTWIKELRGMDPAHVHTPFQVTQIKDAPYTIRSCPIPTS